MPKEKRPSHKTGTTTDAQVVLASSYSESLKNSKFLAAENALTRLESRFRSANPEQCAALESQGVDVREYVMQCAVGNYYTAPVENQILAGDFSYWKVFSHMVANGRGV